MLRLAVLLCRTRSKRARPKVEAVVRDTKIIIKFPEQYLEDRPLTQADLAQEAIELIPVGFQLRIQSFQAE